MVLIFGVNFPECLEAQAKTGVTPGICTAFCSFVSWFWRKPELQKVRVELERAYRNIKEYLHLPERETLLQLANLENGLGGGISLTSFIARFHLGTGIAGEYCFRNGAERRANENRTHPHQRLICYTKRKSCRRQLFPDHLITMAVGPGYFSVAFVVAKEADAVAKKRADGEGNIRKRKDRRPGGENTASGPRFYPVWGTVWVNCKFCKIA